MKRTWILYDSRACGAQGTEDASVLVVCGSEGEARSWCGQFGAMACYSYAKDGGDLTDERWEWDWKNRRRQSRGDRRGK